MYALIYTILYKGLGHLGFGYLQGFLKPIPQVLRDNEALGESKVTYGFSTTIRSAPLNLASFKGQLYSQCIVLGSLISYML